MTPLLLQTKLYFIDKSLCGFARNGMEFRPYYMAREWQKAGHQVVVVVAPIRIYGLNNRNKQDGRN